MQDSQHDWAKAVIFNLSCYLFQIWTLGIGCTNKDFISGDTDWISNLQECSRAGQHGEQYLVGKSVERKECGGGCRSRLLRWGREWGSRVVNGTEGRDRE